MSLYSSGTTDVCPKFSVGQYVRFKTSRVDEMRELISKNKYTIGPFPFGKLTIISYTRNNNTILYNYEYGLGGNHEGFANENDIEPYD